jgi:hypothetical protein
LPDERQAGRGVSALAQLHAEGVQSFDVARIRGENIPVGGFCFGESAAGVKRKGRFEWIVCDHSHLRLGFRCILRRVSKPPLFQMAWRTKGGGFLIGGLSPVRRPE